MIVIFPNRPIGRYQPGLKSLSVLKTATTFCLLIALKYILFKHGEWGGGGSFYSFSRIMHASRYNMHMSNNIKSIRVL